MHLPSKEKEKEAKARALERLLGKDLAKVKEKERSLSVQEDLLDESRRVCFGRWVSAHEAKTVLSSIVLKKAVGRAKGDLDEQQLQ